MKTSLPGWSLRWALILYVVLDRVLNASRVSTEEIRSVSALDEYAMFQVASTGVIGLLLLKQPMWLLRTFSWVFSGFMGWLAAYILLAIASSAWSDAPLLTLFKASQCLIVLLAAVRAISGLPDYEARVRFLVLFGLIYLAVSYFTFFAYDRFSFASDIDMPLPVKLHFVVGTVPFLWTLFLVRAPELADIRTKFLMVMAPFFLLETSGTSYAGVALGLATLLFFRGGFAIKSLLVFFAAIFGLLLWYFFPGDPSEKFLGIKAAAEILEGTGRFDLWAYVLGEHFWKAPWLGHGFVIGDAVGRETGVNAIMGQLHNAHLSAISNLGIAGGFLWAMFMLSAGYAIFTIKNKMHRTAIIAAAAVIAVNQMFWTGSLSSTMHVNWIGHAMFFTLVALSASRRRNVDPAVVLLLPQRRLHPDINSGSVT